MRPTLFSLGILEFHAYTFMLAMAFLAAVLLTVRKNYTLENPYPITPMGGLWVYVGALIGARLYWIIQYDTIWHFYRAVFFWQGGLVFYGGLLGGVLGGALYVKSKHAPVIEVADLTAPYIALGHAIGRIGCFLNGCCWGEPTHMPWGVHFPKASWGAYGQQLKDGLIKPGTPESLPVHPTQLYCALGLVVIFFTLRHLYNRNHATGAIVLLYMGSYGVLRFVVEFFRGDSAHPAFGLTVSQLVALGFVVLSLAAGCGLRRATRKRGGGNNEIESDRQEKTLEE